MKQAGRSFHFPRVLLAGWVALGLAGCDSGGGNLSSTASITATGTQVQLSWSADAGASGYLIEQSSDDSSFTQIQQVSGGLTATAVTGLTAGETYYFRIRAYNTGGDSPYSNTASASL